MKTNQEDVGWAWPRRWIAGGLAIITLLVYLPVRNHDFIDYDDNCYVYENELIRKGLTVEGVRFAFLKLHGEQTYWHPVTWLSHMTDCELFGVAAGPQHLVSVGFHVVNVVLLFLWLQGLTGRRWSSAAVAMLFAWHPLQVDTVAWIAERKNLLSGLFWILALWAYTVFVQRGRRGFYFGALGLYAVGLMCKPAIVTLPCVMLLLDVWPLRRVEIGGRDGVKRWMRLVGEKLPFFGLTVLSSIITLQAHRGIGVLASTEHASLAMRVANSFVSYGLYLRNVFFPVRLAVVYPYERDWSLGMMLAGVAMVALPLGLGWMWRGTRPYLLVGWLWFLGTLVPTIGLVQAGHQAMADRFMYLPVIGVFVVLVWLVAELAEGRGWRPQRVGIVAGMAGAACLVLTVRQVGFWEDTRTVFERALAVTGKNWVACNALGAEAIRRGDLAAAVGHLTEAERIFPGNVEIRYNLALAYAKQGRLPEAAARYEAVLLERPRHVGAVNGLGFVRMQQGRVEEATALFEQALRLAPSFGAAQANLELLRSGGARDFQALAGVREQLEREPGKVELRLRLAELLAGVGRTNEAAAEYRKILVQNGKEVRALLGLGGALARAGREQEALGLIEQAVAAEPKSAEAQLSLGMLLERAAKMAEALGRYEDAVRLKPDLVDGWTSLGLLRARSGRLAEAAQAFGKAVELRAEDAEIQMRAGLAAASLLRAGEAGKHLREALRLRADWAAPKNALAWMLATHPDASVRNGAEAVKLAERACALTEFKNPHYLDVLGAALAEAGRFPEAVAMVEKALQLVKGTPTVGAAGEYAARLELYRAGRAYRQAGAGVGAEAATVK